MRVTIKKGRYIIFLHNIDCHKLPKESLHIKINQCRGRSKLISFKICHLWHCLVLMCHLDSVVNKEWRNLGPILGQDELPWRQSRWSAAWLNSWETKKHLAGWEENLPLRSWYGNHVFWKCLILLLKYP